jgi:hypothetical protein
LIARINRARAKEKCRFHGFWLTMSERQDGPYDRIARRWLALAERRQIDFLELYESGRWRHYYSETKLREEIQKIIDVRERWAKIVGRRSQELELQTKLDLDVKDAA